MKATDTFKQTIAQHLERLASNDQSFAVSFANPDKSLDECVKFILNEVKRSGCNGFADEEIFGMAVHYYDEADLDTSKLQDLRPNVVVNHHVELTAEQKQKLAEKAEQDYYDQQMKALKDAEKRKAEAKRKEQAEREQKFKVVQTSLFG